MEKNFFIKIIIIIALIGILTLIIIIGCSTQTTDNSVINRVSSNTETKNNISTNNTTAQVTKVSGSIYSSSELFTSRDLEQTADLTNAT